ncbi:MAG: DegT/DnrJ/EryC1/StrS family aminotransferase [Acidobacteriota bacterium]|nr:DegT/DnrJ/EryC1/StrS family aminotransferase [Acidobacteriota bacterium]
MPPLWEFDELLADIWRRGHITNGGHYHKQLEQRLAEYLGTPHLSLFTNGTLPILVALQMLRIRGEVITTPYSFPATAHSLVWNGLTPVFVDVDRRGNLDPARIERAITDKTRAILAVHVYGTPCDTAAIQEIADLYGLKVIYDAAHAFGVERDGESVLNAGDLATLSFHATKVYNTVEGGALICRSRAEKERVDYLKNFGFAGETKIIMPGINGKMDELRAAYGLLNLKRVDDDIARRAAVAKRYREGLADVPGLYSIGEAPGVKANHSYFPIFVDARAFGTSRDALHEKLRDCNIFTRRYFYPLISAFSPYKNLPSAAPENLPNATRLSEEVLCLPIYPDLDMSDVDRIIDAIRTAANIL